MPIWQWGSQVGWGGLEVGKIFFVREDVSGNREPLVGQLILQLDGLAGHAALHDCPSPCACSRMLGGEERGSNA